MDQPQPATVILLGASNLAIAWPRIIEQVTVRVAGPRQILTAQGMGRSYLNTRSSFGPRQLPGILGCGLWDALSAVDSSDTSVALITDLGNDLVYGREPQEVAESAAEAVRRIRDWNPETRIVLTLPPVDAVHALGRIRFTLFRTMIFPSCRLTLADAKQQSAELNALMEQYADEEQIPLFKPHPAWYGWDPIHVRRRHQSAAFGQMMDLWQLPEESKQSDAGGTGHVARPTAEIRWVFGREKRTPQPSVAVPGVKVFAY